jgi:hypothetical protein
MDVAKVDRMLHMLQWLYTYVTNVCSQCFIYFSDICCKCVYLDVAYVSHICCNCFIQMLLVFAIVFKCFQVFLQVFRTYIASVLAVSDVCCMCFIWILQK